MALQYFWFFQFSLCIFKLRQLSEKKLPPKQTASTKLQTKKKNNSKIISLGVVNGKAINLVKPDFPLAAKTINVRGSVNVSVLINEEGKVVEAKAVSGHPLLRASSVAAALESTFEPVTLSDIPVRVRGIIIYKYLSDTFNWLEIGNAFGKKNFEKMLPFDFEKEKQMYEKYLTADYENQPLIFQSLQSMIESKLGNNKKDVWLFEAGLFLNKFQSNHQDDEDWKTDVTKLKNLIAGSPDNISKILISNLKSLLHLSENPQLNTYTPQNGSKIYEQIQIIKGNLPMFGN